MKQLTCEMCGSTDLLKQDGVFVCQSCGTKYSIEEAKKMMVEGTVEVKGTVKVDNAEELSKLYQAARNARTASNDAIAIKYYEDIQAKDPNSWEAIFYLAVLNTNSIKNGEIASAAATVANSLPLVFKLIEQTTNDEKSKETAVCEVVSQCQDTFNHLYIASKNFYRSTPKAGLALMGRALEEEKIRSFNISMIMLNCGNGVESICDMNDKDYKTIAVNLWKHVITSNSDRKKEHGMGFLQEDSKNAIEAKIKKYDTAYTSSDSSGGGCYVATAVYGSYDCPQVWTLRRYRDYTLATTWYGRAFIHTYYAISPTLVKWFGKTEWFKNVWKPTLDKLVNKLNKDGVADTPYKDRNWR